MQFPFNCGFSIFEAGGLRRKGRFAFCQLRTKEFLKCVNHCVKFKIFLGHVRRLAGQHRSRACCVSNHLKVLLKHLGNVRLIMVA